jgi:hypothetical protein
MTERQESVGRPGWPTSSGRPAPIGSGGGAQMGEVVCTREFVEEVEGNFAELTLDVGRRLRLGDIVVPEWTCDYGDVRLYRNVTIGETEDGEAVRVTDCGAPTATSEWRRPMTDQLDMPGDGAWPDAGHLH